MRHAKRTDSNQASIVKDLRKAKFQVIVTNMGDDFPDLIAAFASHWVMLEIKKPDGDFTRGQLQFLADAGAPVGFATDTNEAAKMITCGYLRPAQKAEIAVWLVKNPDQQTLSVKKLRKLVNA